MEKLMQYVWQHRLFPQQGLTTVDGRKVSVINVGLLNTDAGPDFFNASVMIGDEHWVGNVEIHVRASDWHRHGHDDDPAYDSVILHVVDFDDTPIRRSDGRIIPQLRLPCSPGLNAQFHALADNARATLPCARAVAQMPPIYRSDWLSSLGMERLQMKAGRVTDLMTTLSGNWEEACYITLARSLGFGVNSEPFERLARSLPLKFMRKHADSLLSVEALLFGQAGMLGAAPTNVYAERLVTEYNFLRTKFGLKPLESPGWKMARMRPDNFPYRRIALLAAIIHAGFTLMGDLPDVTDAEQARRLVMVPLTGFWANHYTLAGVASEPRPNVTVSTADILVINCIVPLMYAYAMIRGDNAMAARAVDILHQLRGEKNSIVAMFETCGIKPRDAFTSQAVIQLRRNYCEQSKCLYCRFGHRYLSAASLRP